MTIRYAYIHCKPNGVPFYVGKGALRRAKYLGERNPYHKTIVKKYGNKNILIGKLECSTDEIAFDLERGLIKCIKAMGIRLANFTEGGEGGINPAPETRKRLSEAAKKRGVSEACQIAKVNAKRGKPISEEQKELISKKLTGRTFTAEHRKNISIAAKKRGMAHVHAALAKKRSLLKELR